MAPPADKDKDKKKKAADLFASNDEDKEMALDNGICETLPFGGCSWEVWQFSRLSVSTPRPKKNRPCSTAWPPSPSHLVAQWQ